MAYSSPGEPHGTEAPEGEGEGIPASINKREGLVHERTYHLTDEEVEHKVLAIKDIREQSHKHKQAVANQSARGMSSASTKAPSPKLKTAVLSMAAAKTFGKVISKKETAEDK